ncbi:hypothetical protein BTO19_23380 [Vibrio parahaemolyticus]|uniref:type II toxin-antitoxin system RelE/ParE family toxin n=1 Tax=Vibrio parahaemolyticus TaxID=670 RepID=UPI00046E643C|nr:type II toxin-antitoxin system RelE/ParE family toxin [Vibrio parahaemolyticus]EHC7291007.1 type II toxin-antitoxin system RelE/ParE family toxin [Vibrio parahaemolyticus]EHK7406874.1 type II toxin-antitoxin system RelE/ParE family toxin [Vibrio parahaemolyticus]EJE4149836.1 type II toxin-antitoxin system RelE/ParE family toxin [Vibrio parahaemolyticus]MDF4269748.1 type II toxin-antitoxin system RelE/ParE family toxin [Vibrio parahaemolyticus]MDF4275084.1 type II toxin-antitoxin system RelE
MNYTVLRTQIFDDWLKSLKDDQARGSIAARVQRLTRGLTGDVESVGSGISELRIHVGKGYRVYYKLRGKEVIVLLCGGNKKTQPKDIAQAKELAKEFGL